MSRYGIEHRYQDSGWEPMEGERHAFEDVAVSRAARFAEDGIFYGMTRVVDTERRRVVVTFPAGGGRPEFEDTETAEPGAAPGWPAEDVGPEKGGAEPRWKAWIKGLIDRL